MSNVDMALQLRGDRITQSRSYLVYTSVQLFRYAVQMIKVLKK